MAAFNAATNPFGALTLTPTLVSALAVGNVIAGYVTHDERGRLFDNVVNGLPIASGDAAAKWLPTVSNINTISVPNPGPVNTNTPVSGPSYVAATWGTSDTVNASSVFSNLVLNPNDYVLVASGTF
jgi:hypothetical protein